MSDAREDRDDDGLSNGPEDATGNDPINTDTDGDGVPDGQEQAGTVAAFDAATGTLTIDLANGSSLTDKVTAATRIECETEAQDEARHRNRGPGSASGSRHGDDDLSPDDSGPRGESGDGPHHDGAHHDAGDDNGNRTARTTADLTAGAPVHEAELTASADGPVFEQVGLVK